MIIAPGWLRGVSVPSGLVRPIAEHLADRAHAGFAAASIIALPESA